MKTVTLILTGSVATIKYNELINTLSAKYRLNVVYTNGAKMFLNEYELINNPKLAKVFSDEVSVSEIRNIEHIRLREETDLILVAPASYNFINKFHAGIAEGFALSLLAAYHKDKIVLAPAMNTNMYESPILQQSLSNLEEIGVRVIPPAYGMLACGDEGIGKLPAIDLIAQEVDSALGQRLRGEVIVTCGSTKMFIDPIRYLTNISSGTFGKLIAQAFVRANYRVHLIHGENVPVADLPSTICRYPVATNDEMLSAIKGVIHSYHPKAMVMNAAPVDYGYTPQTAKIKGDLSLDLVKGIDLLQELANEPLVKFGFALETNDHIENGQKKLAAKGLDFILVNDHKTMKGERVIGAHLISREGHQAFGDLSKSEMAAEIVQIIDRKLAQE